MTAAATPPPEEIVVYEKDPKTKIATITLSRPDRLNAVTSAARLRYADLLHRANIDDDVKVLVIRGLGQDFGSGVDLPEFMEALGGGGRTHRLAKTSTRVGGNMVDYQDEDPTVRDMYAAELKRNGITMNMPSMK